MRTRKARKREGSWAVVEERGELGCSGGEKGKAGQLGFGDGFDINISPIASLICIVRDRVHYYYYSYYSPRRRSRVKKWITFVDCLVREEMGVMSLARAARTLLGCSPLEVKSPTRSKRTIISTALEIMTIFSNFSSLETLDAGRGAHHDYHIISSTS